MPRLFAALAVAAAAFAAQLPDAAASPSCRTCGRESYGTSIAWAGSPSEAAHKAKAEQKLVFVLHVSGNFEDPRFT